MGTSLDRQLVEVEYYLSRRGADGPPSELGVNTWQAAYSEFYKTLGAGKTEREFGNSLKNVSDHFDGHHHYNRRRGWHEDGAPQRLSGLLQNVFNNLKLLDDDTLWRRMRSYLSRKGTKSTRAKKAKFFSSEFTGTRRSGGWNTGEVTVTHGQVVKDLKRYIETTVENAFVHNTRKIDLALDVDDDLRRIYEVKTATDTQSIYTAVGQLCMHSAGAPDVERWIVLPGPIQDTELVECLQTLGISMLWYKFQGKSWELYTILANLPVTSPPSRRFPA